MIKRATVLGTALCAATLLTCVTPGEAAVTSGWASTSSVSSSLKNCSSTVQLTTALYSQTCIASTGSTGPGVRDWQTFTVLTVTGSGVSRSVSVAPEFNTRTDDGTGKVTSKTYDAGSCGQRTLTSGQSYTCVSSRRSIVVDTTPGADYVRSVAKVGYGSSSATLTSPLVRTN